MDCERDGVEEDSGASHSSRVISNTDLGDSAINDNEHGVEEDTGASHSSRVILNTDLGDGAISDNEHGVEENNGGSYSSIVILNTDLGDSAINDNEHGLETSSSSSSSKSSCEDIVRVSSQIAPNSVGESSIHGGSSRSAEGVKDASPILSPSVKVMECPEDYDPDSPAYVFSNDSPTMEGNSPPDDFLFSIHTGNDSFSPYDATTDTVADVDKSTEHLKGSESRNSGEFDQISTTTKGVVDPNMGKAASVDVEHGEKRMGGEPLNNVPVGVMNNQVGTSAGGGTVVLPK